MCLSVEHIVKKHGADTIVARDLSFRIKDGQLGALIGPSGCGKTTLLRMIAGFETPDQGRISVCGKEVVSDKANIAPENRKTGMVFQDYALFPHLTVMENITFGPVRHDAGHIEKLLEVTGLSASRDRYPHELSGGQQQRVALARALAPKPGLLLMDEPFSNLDVSLRESLSEDVRHILNEFGITGLLVTHNQHEAFAMADVIGVMDHGQLLQWDTADSLYYSPACASVAEFVGEGAFVDGIVTENKHIDSALGYFNADTFSGITPGKPVRLFVRPEDVRLDPDAPVKGNLIKSHFRGPGRLHTFRLKTGETVSCIDPCPTPLELNAEYGLHICTSRMRIFA